MRPHHRSDTSRIDRHDTNRIAGGVRCVPTTEAPGDRIMPLKPWHP